jgi:hypothetical protein
MIDSDKSKIILKKSIIRSYQVLRRTGTSYSHKKKRTSEHCVMTTIDGLGSISGKSWHHCFKGWGLAILATMNCTHKHMIHWMSIITQLWMNLN